MFHIRKMRPHKQKKHLFVGIGSGSAVDLMGGAVGEQQSVGGSQVRGGVLDDTLGGQAFDALLNLSRGQPGLGRPNLSGDSGHVGRRHARPRGRVFAVVQPGRDNALAGPVDVHAGPPVGKAAAPAHLADGDHGTHDESQFGTGLARVQNTSAKNTRTRAHIISQ